MSCCDDLTCSLSRQESSLFFFVDDASRLSSLLPLLLRWNSCKETVKGSLGLQFFFSENTIFALNSKDLLSSSLQTHSNCFLLLLASLSRYLTLIELWSLSLCCLLFLVSREVKVEKILRDQMSKESQKGKHWTTCSFLFDCSKKERQFLFSNCVRSIHSGLRWNKCFSLSLSLEATPEWS
jgi:hypothetical protein